MKALLDELSKLEDKKEQTSHRYNSYNDLFVKTPTFEIGEALEELRIEHTAVCFAVDTLKICLQKLSESDGINKMRNYLASLMNVYVEDRYESDEITWFKIDLVGFIMNNVCPGWIEKSSTFRRLL